MTDKPLQSLAMRTQELADLMEILAVDFDYFGGLNAELVSHGRELMGASRIARGWAEQLRKAP